MKNGLKFIALCIIICIVAFVVYEYKTKDVFNENNVVLELFMQNYWSENVGNNDSYYIGIDRNRNMYIRNGDGKDMFKYLLSRRDKNNSGDVDYEMGCDFIVEPIEEKCVKLGEEEYEQLVELMDRASDYYRNEPDSTRVFSVKDFKFYKFFIYKGNYFNTNEVIYQYDDYVHSHMYNPQKGDYNPEIYMKVEGILFKYAGIRKYPRKYNYNMKKWQ